MNKNNTFIEPKKDENGVLQFYSPSGEKIREKYIWNEDQTGLVLKEKIDIVKEMNERAKGTSILEQIARLERGDMSVIDPSRVTPEDFSCDVSGMPESTIEIIQKKNDVKAEVMRLKALDEQRASEAAELKALQDEIIKKKAEYDQAVKAFDDKKAVKVDGGNENA